MGWLNHTRIILLRDCIYYIRFIVLISLSCIYTYALMEVCSFGFLHLLMTYDTYNDYAQVHALCVHPLPWYAGTLKQPQDQRSLIPCWHYSVPTFKYSSGRVKRWQLIVRRQEPSAPQLRQDWNCTLTYNIRMNHKYYKKLYLNV